MSAMLLSGVALLSGWAIWWTWRKRYEAEQRAERALREAAADRELAGMGRTARDLAHDLGNLVAILHLNLNQLDWSDRERASQAVRDVQAAARAVFRMFETWRGRPRSGRAESSEALLGTSCRLLARTGLEIEPRVEAALPFAGDEEDAVRVIENLLLCAAREAIRAGDPRVHVEMTAERLRIASRVRDPEGLAERVAERGLEGSSGRGLAIAREAAGRVGWRVVQALDDEELTFLVCPQAAIDSGST